MMVGNFLCNAEIANLSYFESRELHCKDFCWAAADLNAAAAIACLFIISV